MIRRELSFVRAALFIFLMLDATSRIETQEEEVRQSQFYYRLHISNPNHLFGVCSKSPHQAYKMSQVKLRSLQSDRMKTFKIPYSLNMFGIPLNNSLNCSSECANFYQIFT